MTDDSVVLFPSDVNVIDVLSLSAPERTALLAAGERIGPLDAAALLPPLVPPTMRDFMTFEQHLLGAIRWVNPTGSIAAEWYEAPCFYFTNPLAVVGATQDVEFPPRCEVLDFELELGVVLRKGGTDLTLAEAEDCIGGYTILNDWSARDIQTPEMRIGLGPVKGKDFASTLGPWIVTPDEMASFMEDGRLAVTMSVSINGVQVGSDNSRNMSWSFAEMIAYASRGAVVAPGDVLGSGTCGSGCLAELWGWAGHQDPAPLAPGDVVRMDVEGIGTIENRVVAGRTAVAVPAARRHDGIRRA